MNMIDMQRSQVKAWMTRTTLTGHSCIPLGEFHLPFLSIQYLISIVKTVSTKASKSFLNFFLWVKGKLMSCELDELKCIFKEVSEYPLRYSYCI